MKRLLSISLIGFLLIGNLSLFAEDDEKKGKLDDFEEEVTKTEESESQDSEVDEYEYEYDYDDDDDGGSWFFNIIFRPIFEYFFYVTFIGPPGDTTLVDRDWFWGNRFSAYPYEDSYAGLYSTSSSRNLSYHIYGQYLNNGSDIYGLSLRNQFLPLPFLSLEFDYSFLSEELEEDRDYLHLMNFFINYHRVRLERWTLWWGLGSKGLIGDNSHFGAAFNLGTIIYPGNPVSLQAEYNIGAINETSVQELVLQLNYHFNRHVIYMGYQKHTAGSVDLGGFIVGTGMHF